MKFQITNVVQNALACLEYKIDLTIFKEEAVLSIILKMGNAKRVIQMVLEIVFMKKNIVFFNIIIYNNI